MKRSRLKKSVSSDGIISTGGLPDHPDLADSELPSLVPVSGEGKTKF